MQKVTIHLLPNAHLDPVWLWDWREGLNEAMTTCRAVLDLMDEFEELTFIRGEAAIYRHLERHDQHTFGRIREYIETGRWDVVGGTWIQPDTNLPATETFARHLCYGQRYFTETFDKRVRVAWAADSFGHSAGLPDILVQGGIEGFAFTRPAPAQFAIAKDVFWWEGVGRSRVMAYRPSIGWYGTERDESIRRLDEVLATAYKDGLENVACFVGLGNHGGGPTRRQLREIRKWMQEHPEVDIQYSSLHRLFAALESEIRGKGEAFLPTYRGELNFTLRGCYSSVAKFKYAYRKTEAMVSRAERTDAVLSAALHREAGDLHSAWESVLFNSFHDILPGTSIERAYDDQLAWLGAAYHNAQSVEFDALNALALRVDTTVKPTVEDHPTSVPFLVWNPHPQPYEGNVELEAGLDSRPIWSYQGRPDQLPVEVCGPDGDPVPFQLMATENHSLVNLPWRKRAVVPIKLPPMGWAVMTMGWVEGTPSFHLPEAVTVPAKAVVGEEAISLWDNVKLEAVTVDDPWGSWGGMRDEPESLDLSSIKHRWKIHRVEVIECGPWRTALWVDLRGGASRIELQISKDHDQDVLNFQTRVLWNERSARLKFILSPAGEEADFDIPGGHIQRTANGEVPGGRWVKTPYFGFASDALYNFDLKGGSLRATVVRACRYGDDVKTEADETPWLPAADAGELKFRFLLAPPEAELLHLAHRLEEPVVVLPVAAGRRKDGLLPRRGSLFTLFPDSLRVLALKPAEDGNGLVLRLQEMTGGEVIGEMVWLGERIELGPIGASEIASFRISEGHVYKTDITELETTTDQTIRTSMGKTLGVEGVARMEREAVSS